MFSEELNVSESFSVLTEENICTNEMMWAACTEVLDTEDMYPKFLPEPVVNRLKDILLYEFADPDLWIRKSMSKRIHISHKDGTLLGASVNTAIPIVYLWNKTQRSQVEWIRAKAILGLDDIFLQRIGEMFDLSSPTDIYIDHIFVDLEGNVTGISCNPSKLNNTFLEGTDYHRITQLYLDSRTYGTNSSTILDFDMYKDGSIAFYPELSYIDRLVTMPNDKRREGDSGFEGRTPMAYEKYAPVTSLTDHLTLTDDYIMMLRDSDVIDDDQAVYAWNLRTHDEQEFQFSYKFNSDGSLKDILTHRVEVKDFQVWRP